MLSKSERLKPRVLSLLLDIPPGRVTTYGAIALHLGASSRLVARVLASLDESESEGLPWHRVVGASGVIRTPGTKQAERLRREGVVVSDRNTIQGFRGVVFALE